MRFNPDLMRQVLLTFEAVPAGEIFNGIVRLDDFEQAEVNQHVELLLEDGYFDGIAGGHDRFGTPSAFVCKRLTSKAHDFLANSRNNTVWKKVLAKAQSEGSSVSISVLNGLLAAAAKKYAGLE